jgi:hypothetical protein
VRLVLSATGLLVLATALAGCPRTTPPPDRMGGMPCATHDDCNPDRECGELALCVTGLCESGHSLVVPCPGEGERVP